MSKFKVPVEAAQYLAGQPAEIEKLDKTKVKVDGTKTTVSVLDGTEIDLVNNDWVLKGKSGKLYVCDGTIFEDLFPATARETV